MSEEHEGFEYLVVQVQDMRATFANGQWVGSISLEAAKTDFTAGLNSCMQIWDYVQVAGRDGWEMVGTTSMGAPGAEFQMLYFKRHAV